MRAISQHPGYSLQLFEGAEVREVDARTGMGYSRTAVKPVVAEFISGAEGAGLFPHEVAKAMEVWDFDKWPGIPENANPLPYISVFDTEAFAIQNGLDDKQHQEVIDRLKKLQPFCGNRFVLVDDLKAAKPFLRYDEKDEEQVVFFVQELGLDPSLVLNYERENENRPNLIAALTDMIESNAGEAVASVSA